LIAYWLFLFFRSTFLIRSLDLFMAIRHGIEISQTSKNRFSRLLWCTVFDIHLNLLTGRELFRMTHKLELDCQASRGLF
jgi:hypothetical protein